MGTKPIRPSRLLVPLAVILALASSIAPRAKADPITVEEVVFDHGITVQHREGRIKGRGIVDYTFQGRQGQIANISLATRHTALYFNIMEPGQTEAAIHIGSVVGNQFERRLERDGLYRIRVYLMRSAARRGEVGDYRLEIILTDAGGTALLNPDDALVPGTPYHATGKIPCLPTPTGAWTECAFGVVRAGAGAARIDVTMADGSLRALSFSGHRPAPTPSGASALDAVRQGDEWLITVGKQQFRIPDAVPFGG